ncbi:MAG: hypothetical protein K6D02_00570 [Lachnospiraceae bacterium]|nr:hypothetical protein [Lachnospiraceae bacterium]
METKKIARDFVSYSFMFFVCVLCYFLVDIFLLSTRVLDFSTFVGIKNVLPIILGILYGPLGTAGCLTGCILTHFVINKPVEDFWIEFITIVLVSLISYYLWYFKKKDDKLALKERKDYNKYNLIVLLCAVIAAIVGFIIKGYGAALEGFFSFLVTGIFVGIPTIIIVTSILWVERISPKHLNAYPYFEGVINSSPESLAEFNERLEAAVDVPMKRLFEVESCVEEVMILVKENVPDSELRVRLQLDDSASLRFYYKGKKYNPLHFDKNNKVEDESGIKMIAYRALRASYRYINRKETNYIHIVL